MSCKNRYVFFFQKSLRFYFTPSLLRPNVRFWDSGQNIYLQYIFIFMVNVQRFVLFVAIDEHASNNRSNTSATTSSLENEG